MRETAPALAGTPASAHPAIPPVRPLLYITAPADDSPLLSPGLGQLPAPTLRDNSVDSVRLLL